MEDQGIRGEESVGSYLEELVGAGKVPGIQYVVVNPAHVVFDYAGGWADLARERPMKPSTTLMAYSMSKPVTAAAVLRLADQGALALDEPVSRYVGSVPSGSATVGQLVTHTGGLPNPIPLRWVHRVEEHSGFDERAALRERLARSARKCSPPGRGYRYSNLGYWLLGSTVEAVTGMAFETYVSDHVLAPLGIAPAEMGYGIPDGENHAAGYLEKYSFLNLVKRLVLDGEFIGRYEGRWVRIAGHFVDGPAFGGLVGTARGFGTFLQDQIRPRSALLSEGTRTLMHRTAHTGDGAEIPMTHGWHVATLDDVRCLFKEGGGGGFHSMMRIYPERGIGTIAMTNATAFDVGALMDRLDRHILAAA